MVAPFTGPSVRGLPAPTAWTAAPTRATRNLSTPPLPPATPFPHLAQDILEDRASFVAMISSLCKRVAVGLWPQGTLLWLWLVSVGIPDRLTGTSQGLRCQSLSRETCDKDPHSGVRQLQLRSSVGINLLQDPRKNPLISLTLLPCETTAPIWKGCGAD